ncbi:MAG: DUF72 domain-containing protein [Cellulomonas sp.]|uniref:DUF72 domain-containing protein n=1 Tax=Cellulomonas sp. 73-92 TaxID=1895740 RepID=UPI000927E54B|nr:DUF72 domain-containing protein [Cellulomonas sp. 73-92]MBN9374828.1 DUF72 domain-containing protein [Cellulomonas sp.]OJV78876.1 MAG: hypothetical protein BGO37_00495 [Cellulomonas sp. 73-92]
MADVRVGISGWRYAPWRGVFYPAGLPQQRELEYVAQRLRTVEINGSFYSLQRPERYRAWADQTPDDFLFSVKGGRFVTHMKRLRGVETALANFFASGVLALGPRLGPILWQLPPTTTFEPEVLDAFLALLPHDTRAASALAQHHDDRLTDRAWLRVDGDRPVRHAIEVRHASFRDPAFTALARRHGVAVVVADTAGRWPLLDEPTADVVYVRLHGDAELYTSGYDEPALDRWAARVRGWAQAGRDVLVYFDNDVKVRAPFDAMSLAERLGATPGR